MMNKALQFAAAFLLFWGGCQLAALAGAPLIGQQLVESGVQVAMSHVSPDQDRAPVETGETTTPKHAGTWGLQVHVASFHPSQRAGAAWNESNDGFGLRYAFNDTYAAQLGHYRNEHTLPGFNLFTNYLYGDYTPLQHGPVRLGVFAGLVSGFDDCTVRDGKVVTLSEVGVAPKAGLVGRYQWRALSATLRASPAQKHAGPASVSAELGWTF